MCTALTLFVSGIPRYDEIFKEHNIAPVFQDDSSAGGVGSTYQSVEAKHNIGSVRGTQAASSDSDLSNMTEQEGLRALAEKSRRSLQCFESAGSSTALRQAGVHTQTAPFGNCPRIICRLIRGSSRSSGILARLLLRFAASEAIRLSLPPLAH
ncbi:hypothetical protein NA57DRAFT_52054 [Rhizodiscina lignyota]|uniref:Uncharacterized protein n=1 Tax=Rhizodiscina lignyota TaxID=1504668 RepID=A0A9P4INI3_9PEZI|nr:hypothetical protein NA57DRAFT_52054 [Rhizodiscina lignyota]